CLAGSGVRAKPTTHPLAEGISAKRLMKPCPTKPLAPTTAICTIPQSAITCRYPALSTTAQTTPPTPDAATRTRHLPAYIPVWCHNHEIDQSCGRLRRVPPASARQWRLSVES